MLLTLVTGAAALAALWLFKQWNETKNYWAKRNVPHLPPHPVLGSLTFMMKKNPGIWMREMYNRFPAPYVGIWWLWRPALIIQSPEIARRVLIKDAHIFRDRYLKGGKEDVIGSQNLFTMKDPMWTSLRRRLTPVFTSAKLRNLQGHFIKKTEQLVQRIKMEMETNKRVNLRMVYTDYTTDVVGSTSFGVESEATLTGEGALRTVTKDFMQYNFWRGLAWASIFFFPDFTDFFGFTFFPKAATNYFRKMFQQILSQREAHDGRDLDHGDLFDALRKIKKESDRNNEELPQDMLVAQAAIFLQGGFDTSASTIAFTSYEIAYQPHIQDKLYEEISEIKQNIGESALDADILQKAKYLHCVINETLRKYPPMGWLDRIAATDYEIDENLTIPAGTPVYVNNVGMQCDPQYYPDPLLFDPDRFLHNEDNITPFTFLPFGEGPRNCVGRRFAMQNMAHMLANIVLNYKIVPDPGGCLPAHVEIEKKGLFLFPAEDLYVKFVPRDA